MKIIDTTFERLPRERLEIGFEGENLRATVRIDCASVFAEYPNATPSLIVKPLFADAYPVVVDRNGTDVDWLITSEILSFTGDGEIQLVFYKDEVICKSAITKIRVCRSLTVTGEMPDVVATWIENANRKLAEVDAQIVELEGMVDTATDAATRAEQSASTASTKAEQAAGSAATATAKANEATNAAGTATAKATEAEQSAQTATQKATAAADSERIATAKAAEAAQSAQTAAQKAGQITEAAQIATGKAEEASASATAAQTSATNAASSATAAQASQTAAEASETAAGASATQAAQSAQSANTAAQTATQKAGEAATSATNAATSATNAATNAETASTKAGEAAQSAQAVEETAEQLAESLEQISQNTADIAEHKQEYNALKAATLIHNTASGTIASFPDGAEMPVDEVTAQINPVQDLHGYDHPWPGGGGKNLLNIDENVMVARGYNRFFPISLAAGDYVISRSGIFGNGYGSQVVLTDDTMSMSVTILQVIAPSYAFGQTGSPESYAFTITEEVAASAKYLELQVNGNGISFADIESCKLMVEAGTTKTAYAPYSNICPITGWDGVKVTRTGKNLLDIPDKTIASEGYIFNDSFDFLPGQYVLSYYSTTPTNHGAIAVIGKDDVNCSVSLARDNSRIVAIINAPKGIKSIRVYNGAATYTNIQLEIGSTASDYEPYAGNTYEVSLPTEAGTVYGGTLDVSTGELVVDRAMIASYNGETLPGEWISDRDVYTSGATPTTGAQVVYTLATPITYTLTPTEIRTLLGQNNIWADTGDVSVKYKADTKLYIDGKIAELVARIVNS